MPPSLPRLDNPRYWDGGDLRQEMGRVLDICNGCRRCWNLCPSFGNVFKRIDAIDDAQNQAATNPHSPEIGTVPISGNGGEGHHAATADPSLLLAKNPVEGLEEPDYRRVVDECYECKLCYNHCPYHPPHRFMLDFPRLMQRAKAVRVKKEGVKFTDRILAQVDFLGTMASLTAPLANWSNEWKPWRVLLEYVLGIDRRRNLPSFYSQTFRSWWNYRGPKARTNGRVALFYTCSVNYNEPDIGKAAVAVLEKNGFEVICPTQSCCGMPHLDGGDMPSALAAAQKNVARLLPLAQQGVPILALGPTCSYMLKEEYPTLLLGSDAAKLVAGQTYDINEFLAKLKKEGKFNTDFKPLEKKVAYHLPCHLKAQNIGFKSKELLESIPGISASLFDRCSAHDGTWAMKKEYYQLSLDTAKPLFEGITESIPSPYPSPKGRGQSEEFQVATDCPLAALQITQGTGLKPKHPIQIIAEAYGIAQD